MIPDVLTHASDLQPHEAGRLYSRGGPVRDTRGGPPNLYPSQVK